MTKPTVEEIEEAFTAYKGNPSEVVIHMCALHAHQLLSYCEPIGPNDTPRVATLKQMALDRGVKIATRQHYEWVKTGVISMGKSQEFILWLLPGIS
jgi:hypothetical protein